MNPKQLAFHLYVMAVRANPNGALEKMQVLYMVAEGLDIYNYLAADTFAHIRRNEYVQMIAEQSSKFQQLQTPTPKIEDFFNIFANDFQYNPRDNVKVKDQRSLDIAGWSDLNMDIYATFAGTKENGMSRFTRLMKQKSDINRKTLENCRTSLLDLAVKIYKKQSKYSE